MWTWLDMKHGSFKHVSKPFGKDCKLTKRRE